MLRSRLDVAAVFSGREPRVARRRPLIDMRAFAPEPSRRISTRYSRAVSLADAAMIMALGDTPRAARRCAIVVQRALDALDAEAGEAVTDATDTILARCANCGRCGAR